ncbi:NeuD/PglB/VioB family sugar acetyltransferase [Bacterioplanoides sp.]|uniref:NeuD/PglB/VioB family sugar acetyltransferase n=1 Tax=Bacterioplanoides sp. TaxID=2066072 RepID=UPI003AFFD523
MSSNEVSLPIWYVYGAGGLGQETMDIIIDNIRAKVIEEYQLRFLVDASDDSTINGISVVELNECKPGANVTVAVGEPKLRAALAEKAIAKGLRLASVISNRAFVSESATIGDGSIIAPFASLQSMAKVGSNVSINTQTIVGHHVEVQDGAVISSQVNLGGAVVVGECSYVGMGAMILEQVKIGSWSIIGMGSAVYKDISDEVIALGNPARVARKNEDRKVFK